MTENRTGSIVSSFASEMGAHITKRKSKKTARTDETTNPPIDPLNGNSLLLQSGLKAQANMFERVIKMNQEYLAFLAQRFDQDRQFVSSLAEIPSLTDAPSAWVDFLSKAHTDYVSVMQRLTAIYTDAVFATSEDIEQRVEKAFEVAEKSIPGALSKSHAVPA